MALLITGWAAKVAHVSQIQVAGLTSYRWRLAVGIFPDEWNSWVKTAKAEFRSNIFLIWVNQLTLKFAARGAQNLCWILF